MFGDFGQATVNAVRDTVGHHPVAMRRHFLARGKLGNRDWFMEFDRYRGLPKAEDIPQMTRHFHIAVPSKIGPITAPDRYPVQAGIGNGNWLDREWFTTDRIFGSAEKSAFERQHAVAVIARSLREQD